MKLCFSTLGCTERSLDDILTLTRKFDFHALEIRGIGGVMDNRKIPEFDADHIDTTIQKFAVSDIRPKVLGTSCAFHTPDKYIAAEAEGRACIDIAARLGIPYIRVFGNNLIGATEEDKKDCMARVSAGIAALCNYAIQAALPVTVLLEVHGDYNRIETLAPVVAALADYPNFGLIWDIAHTHAYGDGWQDFYQTFRAYIRHVHIKDRLSSTGKLVLPGDGNLPIIPIVQTLLADGYDGFFSLEWEKKWHPELSEIEIALTRYLSIMKGI